MKIYPQPQNVKEGDIIYVNNKRHQWREGEWVPSPTTKYFNRHEARKAASIRRKNVSR